MAPLDRRLFGRFASLAPLSGILAAAGGGDADAVGSMPVHLAKGKAVLKDDKPLTSGRAVSVPPAKGLGRDGAFSMTSSYGKRIPEGSNLVRIEPEATPGTGEEPSAREAGDHPCLAKFGNKSRSGPKADLGPEGCTPEPFRLASGAADARSARQSGGPDGGGGHPSPSARGRRPG